VRGNEIAFGNSLLDVEAQLWELSDKAGDELHEGVAPIRGHRVVLDVFRT